MSPSFCSMLNLCTFLTASKYNSNGGGGGGGGHNSGFYNSSNYSDNHRNRNSDNSCAPGGRGSGRGRGRGSQPATLRSSNNTNNNNHSNSANISIGVSMAPQSAITVQNSNTYDINAIVTIGIDETVPLGGIIISPINTYSTEGNGGAVKEEIKIGTNPNDPYGVGLTERELSYVTADNKLLLFEVSADSVRLFYCLITKRNSVS